MSDGIRELLVFGEKTFKISIPDTYKITFGPFSPPSGRNGYSDSSQARAVGTLRIYDKSKERQVACFAGVRGFRDLSLHYAEEIAVEEGARIWKSDEEGYVREEKVKGSKKWVQPQTPALPASQDDNPSF